MDAFDDERLVRLYGKHNPFRSTFAGFKVKARYLNLLAAQKRRKIVVEARNIKRIDVFKIHLPMFVARDHIAVQIVIVQRKHDGILRKHAKLRCDAVRACGLS